MKRSLEARSPAYLALAVGLVATLAYSNTFRHDFVWDDRALILNNPRVMALNWGTIEHLFTTHFWESTSKSGGLYRPLVSLSYHIDYALHGFNAGGYHVTNTVLNAVVAILFFFLVLSLFGNRWLALVGGLLFATLPLHTENVAWIAGRSDVLATLWVLASANTYVLWRRSRRLVYLGLSLIGFALALLSKELALVGLPVVVLLEFGGFADAKQRQAKPDRRRRTIYRSALRMTPYIIVAALYLYARKLVLVSAVTYFKPASTGILDTAVFSLSLLARYTYRLIFPFFLNAEVEFEPPDSVMNIHSGIGLALLVGVTYALYRHRHRGEYVFAIAVLILGLLPVLHIVPITETSAERFLYMPSLGFALILSALLVDLARRGGANRNMAAGIVAALALSYSVRTYVRNFDWKDETTLFRKTIQTEKKSARAHLNLGNVHYREGRYHEALTEYRAALEIDPDYAGVWSSCAGAYTALGQLDEAVRCMERALDIEPGNPNFHNSIGVLFIRQEAYDRAIGSFRRALELHAHHPKAQFNLALALFLTGDRAESLTLFENLPFKDVSFVHAYYYLAVIESERGNARRAARYAEKFLSLYTEDDGFKQQARELLSGG